MKEFLFISIILCNFAKWIDGSHEPLTRVIQQPFHFVNLLESLNVGKDMKRLTTQEFINRAREVHGDKYDYDKVCYVNSTTHVKITCPIHGIFQQTPAAHLQGQGCPQCGFVKISKKKMLTQEHVIELFKQSHPEENYDYSNVHYIGNNKEVEIICPIHGSFFQTPVTHIYKSSGCPLCAFEKIGLKERKGKRDFVVQANKVHNNKYSYNLVPENLLLSDKIPITCPVHGVFYQNANNHLRGAGCPHCPKTTISRGEDKVCKQLKEIGIEYIPQYKIPNEDLFCKNKNLYVDFYIPSKNTFIEYNGEQHYNVTGYFGGEQKLIDTQERDMALRQYCERHKIKLIEIPYWDFDNIEKILKKELKIKKNGKF